VNRLEVHGLSKRFGGVVATDRLDLAVSAGELHAVIGPNGAGKTSLIAQLAGTLAPDAGTIVLDGIDITHRSAHARVAAGIARSYQVTNVFRGLSALDNARLAVQACAGSSFRFWQPVALESELDARAQALLAQVGLAERGGVIAGTLAHGEQRQLEIALVLASSPRMLLLDEPMAGMSSDESERMVALIGELKARTTILLVEHDMDAVFRLADRISVLVRGRVIATDSPAAIRINEDVRRAYLGAEAAA
jgi:branched-chain amino acid transport system ATP-binding protein